MTIHIKINPAFQEFTDDHESADVEGKTVGDCLENLVERFPMLKERLYDKQGKLQGYVDIFVNTESCFPEGLKMAVQEGDELNLMAIYGGG